MSKIHLIATYLFLSQKFITYTKFEYVLDYSTPTHLGGYFSFYFYWLCITKQSQFKIKKEFFSWS